MTHGRVEVVLGMTGVAGMVTPPVTLGVVAGKLLLPFCRRLVCAEGILSMLGDCSLRMVLWKYKSISADEKEKTWRWKGTSNGV